MAKWSIRQLPMCEQYTRCQSPVITRPVCTPHPLPVTRSPSQHRDESSRHLKNCARFDHAQGLFSGERRFVDHQFPRQPVAQLATGNPLVRRLLVFVTTGAGGGICFQTDSASWVAKLDQTRTPSISLSLGAFARAHSVNAAGWLTKSMAKNCAAFFWRGGCPARDGGE